MGVHIVSSCLFHLLEIQCPSPPILPNAHMTSKSTPHGVGAVLEYECMRGFRFRDGRPRMRSVCTSKGSWTSLSDGCQRKSGMCGNDCYV